MNQRSTWKKACVVRSIGFVVASSFFFSIPSLFAANYNSTEAMEVSGEAEISDGNLSKAKQEALKSALENAILKSSEPMLSPAQFSKNKDIILDRLAKKRVRFVRDYKILSEMKEGDQFKVQIRVVALSDKVHDELVRWGIVYDRANRPRIGLFPLKELRQGKPSSSKTAKRWTRLLSERLKDLGYSVDTLSETAEKSGEGRHDVSVWGHISQSSRKSANYSLQAVHRQPYAKMPGVSGRVKTEDGERLAVGVMAARFLEKLLPAWFVRVGEGRVYKVRVAGFRSGRPYQAFLDVLNSGRNGFSSGREIVYEPGAVTFRVIFDGSVFDLVKTLRKTEIPGAKLAVNDVKSRSVFIEAK